MPEYLEVTTAPPGSGARVATDTVTIGADVVNVQRVKIGVGPDGSYQDLILGQQPKTGSLPVVLASDQGALAVTNDATAGPLEVVSFAGSVMGQVNFTTTPYTQNDVIGGIITFTNAARANNKPFVITSFSLLHAGGVFPDVDVLFFRGAPTGTYTDNQPPSWGNDWQVFVGQLSIYSSDWRNQNGWITVTLQPLNFPVTPSNTANLQALVLTKTNVTFAINGTLFAYVGVLRG